VHSRYILTYPGIPGIKIYGVTLVRIAYGPIWSQVVSASTQEYMLLRRVLLTPEGVYLLRPDWSFLTGLVGRIKAAGIPVEGEPVFPDLSSGIYPDMLEGVTLRDYQLGGLGLFAGVGRGTAAHATGAGKSEFLAAVMKLIGPPSLCVVDTTASAGQLAKRLQSRGIGSVRHVHGPNKRLTEHNVMVINTAINMLRRNTKNFQTFLRDLRLLSFDEVHHLGNAPTWQEIALSCSAHYRLGLSATPYDDEPSQADMLLDGLIGPVFDHIPSKELRDRGYLSEPYAFIIPVAHGQRVPRGIQDWNEIEKRAIVEHEYRNALITTICARIVASEPTAKILVLVRRIQHGETLLDALDDCGISCVFSSGGKQARFPGRVLHRIPYESICERFEDGDWNVLIGSRVYDESQDIPGITDLVLGSAGKKTRRLLQRLGRGERVAPGKDHVRVWDFYDSQHWATRNQSVKRRDALREEEIHIISSPMLIERVLTGQCSPASIIAAIRGTGNEDTNGHSGGVS